MGKHSSEIVVGVDFGTTHSGVSWAVNIGSKVIRLINNWPNPIRHNSSKDKVPSSISYQDGKPFKWGYNVGLTDESFKWMKILLEENHEYTTKLEPVRDSNTLLRRLNKTADEVVSDYLKLLWEYTKDDIRRLHPEFEDIYDLRVILTVPAMWSPTAKEKTIQAARIAGMPNDIKLVTEPEAAALATLKDKAEESSLMVGDAFVVCDAGGGTVDLISYEVQGLNPLKIKECAVGSGGLCGSVFLDIAFQKYICTIVGTAEYNRIKAKNRMKMMQEFENCIKRGFSENSNQEYSVDLEGVKDDRENDIIDGTIVIKTSALQTVFDIISLQIENLIAKQMTEVSKSKINVKAILLVGGFGENRYLYDRLMKCHANDGIKVMQVNGAWSSICRGATLWGLEHSELAGTVNIPTVVSRVSRYSYGLAFSCDYDASKHHLDDRFQDESDGQYKARNQMNWVLRRGEEVKEGRILNISSFWTVPVGVRDFSTILFYNEDVEPPTRKTDAVRLLCKVNYAVDHSMHRMGKSFQSPITKTMWCNWQFQLNITLGNATLDFAVMYKDKLVGHVKAEYKEEF